MSFRLVDRILECVGIPHAALLLLAYIAKHARDDGTGSTIGHRLIAKRMGLEVRALAKHFATLRAHGLIQPRRRFSPTGGGRANDKNVIDVEAIERFAPPPTGTKPPVGTKQPSGTKVPVGDASNRHKSALPIGSFVSSYRPANADATSTESQKRGGINIPNPEPQQHTEALNPDRASSTEPRLSRKEQQALDAADVPTFDAEQVPGPRIKFFCPYCEKPHYHGSAGHCVALHCKTGHPFPHGYVLQAKPVVIAQPINGREAIYGALVATTKKLTVTSNEYEAAKQRSAKAAAARARAKAKREDNGLQ